MVAGEGRKPALILSVGGAEEAMKRSIAKHSPGVIIALASIETEAKARDLGADRIFTTEDHENLEQTYRKARECIEWTRSQGYGRKNTVIDITSGTKIMSVALALAGTREQIPYSYIGGDRNSDGTVISGSERIIQELNPDELFASSSLEEARLLNNRHEYAAAAQLMHEAYDGRETRVKPLLKAYRAAFRALNYWDGLRYKKALEELSKARIDEDFRDIEERDARFFRELHALQPVLQALAGADEASEERIHDLIANAKRRARQDRWDDAVLRLYRVVEMVAQFRLLQRGIRANAVDWSKVPARCLKKVRVAEHQNSVDMFRAFKLLRCMGDEAGDHFWQNIVHFSQNITLPRNESVLAHGFRPVNREVYDAALDYLRESGWVRVDRVRDFPLFNQASFTEEEKKTKKADLL